MNKQVIQALNAGQDTLDGLYEGQAEFHATFATLCADSGITHFDQIREDFAMWGITRLVEMGYDAAEYGLVPGEGAVLIASKGVPQADRANAYLNLWSRLLKPTLKNLGIEGLDLRQSNKAPKDAKQAALASVRKILNKLPARQQAWVLAHVNGDPE